MYGYPVDSDGNKLWPYDLIECIDDSSEDFPGSNYRKDSGIKVGDVVCVGLHSDVDELVGGLVPVPSSKTYFQSAKFFRLHTKAEYDFNLPLLQK